jgi:hypothetical protein
MPSLRGSAATPGGTLAIERRGPAGVWTVIVLSPVAPTLAWPGLDPIWVHPNELVVEAFALTTTAALAVLRPVPSLPALRGLRLTAQAMDFGPAGDLAASNPTACLVR